MNRMTKCIFYVLTSLGLVSVAHAYGPGTPPSLTSVPPDFTACGVDGKVCKVTAGANVYVVYGTGNKFLTAVGTGDFTCLPKGWVKNPSPSTPQDLGVADPVPNVTKTCYVKVASPLPVPAPTPTPAPKPAPTPTPAPATLTEADKAQIRTLFSSYSTCKSGFGKQIKMNFWYQEEGGFVWNNAKKGSGAFDSDGKLGTTNNQFKSSINALKSKMDTQDKTIVMNSVANAKLLADACTTNTTEAQTQFQGVYQNRDALYAAACSGANAALPYCNKNAYVRQYPQTWK